MLGKLIKYEWKAVSKICLIVLLSMAGLTLLGSIYYRSPLWSGVMNGETGDLAEDMMLPFFMGLFSFIAYVILMVGLQYGMVLYLLIHFYRSMYGDEGYLTHTLPVTSSQLLLSRIFVGGVWTFLVSLLGIASVSVLLTAFMMGALQGTGLSAGDYLSLLRETLQGAGIPWGTYVMVAFLSAFVGAFANMSLFFCGITIGQLARKNRGLMAVLGCIGVWGVEWVVSFAAQMLASLGGMVYTLENGSRQMPTVSYYVSVVVSALLGVVTYFLTRRLIDRRLNLT